MIKKKFKDEERNIELHIGSWCKVFVDGSMIANVINEEEARRVIWLGLQAQGENIDFVSEDMFELLESEE